MRRSTTVALVLLLGSCSLLFEPSEENQQPDRYEPVICEGELRLFDRGTMLAENRYRHIDFRQGTITLWVRNLQPFAADDVVPLMSTGGIALAALSDTLFVGLGGAAGVEGDGTGAYIVPDTIDWEPGVDHFITLRWDSKQPLSGSGSQNAHIEVTVDKRQYLLEDEPYEPVLDSMEESIIVGAGMGLFDVDQAVIYSRPLYVNDDDGDLSDLARMAGGKSDSGRLSQGGFDVLFASASPRNDTCENFKARAWAMPVDDLLPGDLQLGDASDWTGGFFEVLAGEGQVYPGGGLLLPMGNQISATVNVQRSSSYVLEVVSHSSGGGRAVINVGSIMATAALVDFEGVSADRENPERALLTFDTGSATQVQISLRALGAGVAYHSVVLRRNLISSAGFESGELADDGPWGLDTREGASGPTFDLLSPYAGAYSVCMTAPDGPSTLIQAPPDEQLTDHEFYLFGGEFLWRDGETPGVGIGNGSFFATGVPYEAERKASASAYEKPSEWQLVGTVGRRLQDGTLDNYNDNVRFGSTTYGEGRSSDYCMDSAFTFKLDRIIGLTQEEF